MSALASFTAKLNRMAAPATWEQFKERAAAATETALLKTYDAQTDPYGAAWAQVAQHPGHRAILNDKGKLRGSFKRRTTGFGFVISVTDRKAGFHQHGTRRMVARRFLPTRGLPLKIQIQLRLLAKRVFA